MVRELETSSAEETAALGERLGRLLRGGEVLGLVGELGAGKTCFVRGLARGLALDPDVVYSPTFTLIAEYVGPLTLYHVDLFRLGESIPMEETEEIGLGECLASNGVTAIEWASRLESGEGLFTLIVELEPAGGDRRRVRLRALDSRGTEILAGLGEGSAA